MRRCLTVLPLLAILLLVTSRRAGAETDLKGYRTVASAIAARTDGGVAAATPLPGFLGVHVGRNAAGQVIILDVAARSPAALANLQPGDVLTKLDGRPLADESALHEALGRMAPGGSIKLELRRGQTRVEAAPVLTTFSRLKAPADKDVPRSETAKAKEGDGTAIQQGASGTEQSVEGRRPAGWDARVGGSWSKPLYRLAVICVEYPDEKHNLKITSAAWEESLYSTGAYLKTSITGQPVYGSVNDVYREQSFGKLRIEGKVFDFVDVSKKRGDYATGNRAALLTEATDKLLAREGQEALSKYDGVFFLYAGARYPAPRGSLYWPHRGSFTHGGKRWPYFICPEGGAKMTNISVFAHEFGHMVGLPDLYARPENPGMEGLGQWCMMSNQVPNGRPQHFCAWSKERMGWIKPTVIDPTVKQKLILAPIEDSPSECLKVLVHRDGSEYLLLENRARKGFDTSLPGEGLLIWRVIRNRPQLEESHGVAGPAGPYSFPTSVPYPSQANDSFTPFTTPSSRSHLGGGLPVYITNIRRLADGRVSFHIGYEYQ